MFLLILFCKNESQVGDNEEEDEAYLKTYDGENDSDDETDTLHSP